MLAAIYFGLRYFAYVKINSFLPEENKISFGDVDVGFFPLRLKVQNLKALVIKDKKVGSFEEMVLEVSLLSLFSDSIEAEIHMYRPRIYLDAELLKKSKKQPASVFKIPPWLEKSKLKLKIIDGEFVYETPKLYANLVRFNLYSFAKGESNIYRLTSPHLKIKFPLSKQEVTVEGQMILECKRQASSFKISKFYWETEHVTVNANGRMYYDGRMALSVYTQGSGKQILDPILKKLSIQEFMYANARVKKSKGGLLSIAGDASFNAFTFGGVAFSDLKAKITWDNLSKRIKLNGTFRDGPVVTSVEMDKKGKQIQVLIRNILGDKVVRAINIDKSAPIGSLVKKGKITINKGVFTGTAEIVQLPKHPPVKFNVAGKVDFHYISKLKKARFSSPSIKTEFGTVANFKGEVDPNQKVKVWIKGNASVNNVGFIDKYTKYYINLSLDRWKLRGGRSTIGLDLKKYKSGFVVDADVRFRDIYSGVEPLKAMTGLISTRGNLTSGNFSVQDDNLKGNIRFTYKGKEGELDVNLDNMAGKSEKMLNILNINLGLQGHVEGDYTFKLKRGLPYPHLTGNFRSGKLTFYGFDFSNLSGELDVSEAVSLKDLSLVYQGGKGTADVYINYPAKRFDIKGKIDGIDLNRMNNQFAGKADVNFNGKGSFEIDPIRLEFSSDEIRFYKEKPFSFKGWGNIFTDFSQFLLEADGNIFSGDNISSPVRLRLSQSGGRYDGRFNGDINDINLVVPWGNNKGSIIVDGKIANNISNPDIIDFEGHASLSGSVLSFPNFPHALENFNGDLIFNDLNFTLRSIRGTLGNGGVEGNGYINIKANKVEDLFFSVGGRGNTLYLMDRTSFTTDADLTLKYTDNRLLLAGELRVLSGRWEREIDDGISFNTNPSLSPSVSTIMNMLDYDLRIVGDENVEFDNSFAKGSGRFDLSLTGNVDFPIVLGSIESRRGSLYFSGKAFDIIKGKIVFNNKFRNDPILDIESEAFIKNYRLQFNIKGPSSKSNITLISSPPLSTPDIMSLIAVGELFRRSTSSDLSTQVGRGTTGLIASELTDQIQKRTKKIFGDYILRIDPNITNISGSSSLQNTSRLIVGKRIARDFLVVYSTNFADQSQREQVVYVQYQLSPSISLIAMRNHEGRYSLDLRFRRRY